MEGTWIIKIEMGNDALQYRMDVADMLRNIADEIEMTPKIRGFEQDINGNTVAQWEFIHD